MTRFQIGFVLLLGLSVVFPAVSAQESGRSAPATPPRSGGFGVRQVDPFRKDETPKSEDTRPNVFQELLDRVIVPPTRQRQAAQPRRTMNRDNLFGNPFEDDGRNPFDDEEENPFESNPFGATGSFSGNPNPSGSSAAFRPFNPFAAGDPFADEDPRNQPSRPSPSTPENR